MNKKPMKKLFALISTLFLFGSFLALPLTAHAQDDDDDFSELEELMDDKGDAGDGAPDDLAGDDDDDDNDTERAPDEEVEDPDLSDISESMDDTEMTEATNDDDDDDNDAGGGVGDDDDDDNNDAGGGDTGDNDDDGTPTLTDVNDGSSFNVNEILSSGSGDNSQDQRYLNDGSNAPVVSFILSIINFITRVIGVIAMLLIIVGGLMMIASQGEEHLLQKGKDTLKHAIFGLVITMFAYIIVRFVQSLFYLQ